MFQRTDIAFEDEAGVKEHGLERFAEKFASNGFVVLLRDHRNFGASDGMPRQDIDPWRQIADWRRAINLLEYQDVVDAKRIGLWGTSYTGGHFDPYIFRFDQSSAAALDWFNAHLA